MAVPKFGQVVNCHFDDVESFYVLKYTVHDTNIFTVPIYYSIHLLYTS